ncbi:MAG: Omp28 family outer membrane lipoprotein [Saprospiraceae bacterium]|nr:Omp28 family outer membrane lipoprotein [Saprospiraceae bacterium]MDW8483148.1 Omp28 family outer membrane lipoprotein [Saprospiraceae bacterium]
MKSKAILGWASLAILLGLASCEENWVIIEPARSGKDSPGAQKRAVLVEELTGVRCPNCPEGTAALSALQQQHGDRLVIVAIHAALGYNQPYPQSRYDFRTPKGTEMANYIGSAFFFPAAAINRRVVPPETEPYLPRQLWAGIIAEELAKPLLVDLDLKSTYEATSRRLDVQVNITPLQDLVGEHRLTVVVTQDSIVDYQKVNLVTEPNYLHRHVLRSILTSATGDVLPTLQANKTVERSFSLSLPADWVQHHCSVVAFIHRGGTPDKEVLQVVEKHIL